MNRYIFTIILAILMTAVNVYSQDGNEVFHKFRNIKTNTAGLINSTGNSGTGANIDVVYHRIAWVVDPNDAAKNISGTITTHFRTLVAGVDSLSFDLNKSSFDNVMLVATYHGTSCSTSFPSSGNVNIVSINLPSVIPAANTLDSIVIEYSGTPLAGGLSAGYNRYSYTDASSTTQYYVATLSESYEDRDWWPCKADMQDKIDSMDIEVTVPWTGTDTFWVASNGKLIDSTISGNSRIFKYKSRYPIASYLVCLSAAKFNRYYRNIILGGTDIPVQYYLLAGKSAGYYTNAVTAMDKINAVVLAYSEKVGDYPFKLEKHGFYDGLSGAAGMEHQTFSTIAAGALTNINVLVHELMHQWFGDNVTFATWNDLWLAEGFARYGEQLAAELVPALGLNLHSQRINLKNSALSNTVSPWIPDANTGSSTTIWYSSYGSAVYVRGGMVVAMLRALAGDSIFFQALTTYQTNLAGSSASTDSLKNIFNNLLGVDISEFFRDYVGGSGPAAAATGGIGNPIYDIGWNSPAANRLVLRINSQAKSSPSNVSYYNGPVAVRATAPGKDTTIIMFDWGGGNLSFAGNSISAPVSNNLLSYKLSFTPTALVYDDSAKTLSTGSTNKDVNFSGYVWDGSISDNWNDPSNWASCCGVPPDGADVTIATTVHAPALPGTVTIRHLTLNTTKILPIGGDTLIVTGSIDGAGVLSGSVASSLVINGNAGVLNFDQTSTATRSLQSLILNGGSIATLATDLEVASFLINPTAEFIVAATVNLITK